MTASSLKGPAWSVYKGERNATGHSCLQRDGGAKEMKGKRPLCVFTRRLRVLGFISGEKIAGASVRRRPYWPAASLHSSRMWMFSGFLGHSWRREGGGEKKEKASRGAKPGSTFALRDALFPLDGRGAPRGAVTGCPLRAAEPPSRGLITNNVAPGAAYFSPSPPGGGGGGGRYYGHDHRLTRVHVYAQHKL